MDRRFLIYTCSCRPRGNAWQLARRAARALPADHVEWIDLATADVPPFADLRPVAPPLSPPLEALWSQTARATDLVFATPIYWYALPAPAKLWLDHWSGFLDHPDLNFAQTMRGKSLWLMTTRADPDPGVARPIEEALRQTARWLGMEWGGALHAIADGVDEVQTSTAWDQAKAFLTQPPLA